MKRIILAALVGVMVSGPVWAAGDPILLHCTGEKRIKNGKEETKSWERRILLAREGEWAEFLFKRLKRVNTLETRPWFFFYKRDGYVLNVYFHPLTLEVTGSEITRTNSMSFEFLCKRISL